MGRHRVTKRAQKKKIKVYACVHKDYCVRERQRLLVGKVWTMDANLAPLKIFQGQMTSFIAVFVQAALQRRADCVILYGTTSVGHGLRDTIRPIICRLSGSNGGHICHCVSRVGYCFSTAFCAHHEENQTNFFWELLV